MAVFASRSALRHKRSQLRLLDACLTQLEDAHERDESRISPALARRLAPYVPALRPGMLIADGIERVLQEQERYLSGDPERPREPARSPARASRGELPAAPASAPPLDEREARELTRRIRDAAGDVCLLIFEAHRRNASGALGYRSWEHYVRQEFSMSRRRSYELLDQAQVVLAIRDRVPLAGVPQISPFVAGYLKSHLDEVVAEIRTRLAEGPHMSQELAVKRVIDAERKRFADLRRQRFESRIAAAAPAEAKPRWDSRRFWQAIEALASLPPVADVAAYPRQGGTSRQEAQLARVAAWLAALVDRLEERVA
jgi:hypothetical protein